MLVLNLIKKKEKNPREKVLGAEFAAATHNINRTLPPVADLRVQYLAVDFSTISSVKGSNFMQESLQDVA